MKLHTTVACSMLVVLMICLNTVCGIATFHKIPTTFDRGVNVIGACSLPKADYAVKYPIGLGNIAALGGLKFDSDLCGRVLIVNCGNGDVDVIVTNSYAGGGLNLPKSTWNKATNNKPPGTTTCSIRHTTRNPLTSTKPVCYFSTGEVNNEYYRNVGVMNTNGKAVKRAQLNGKWGVHQGENMYYAFNGKSKPSDIVKFHLNLGKSSVEFKISDCLNGANKQVWN